MNRFPFQSLSAMFFAIAFTFSFGALASEVSIKKQSDAKSAFAKAAKTDSSNPWHFSNLYDDASNSFFVSLPFVVGRKMEWQQICRKLYAQSKKTLGYLKEVTGNANKEYQHQLISKEQGLQKQ